MSHHHRRDSGGDVVHVIPTNNPPPDNWFPNLGDSAVWATEDDYNRVWAVNPDNISGDNNGPPNKKTRGSPSSSSATTTTATTSAASNRTKAIGKMFFKTKLCCKFRAGTCPYVTNCNFAHTVRRPPPNWQEIVAAHEEERSGGMGTPTVAVPELPREEFQIPSLVSSTAESGRSFKGRHCKKFYTEEGCPYGESCTFLHDEASRNRESVAISLGPGGYGSGGGSGGGGGSASGAGGAGNSNVVVLGGGAGGSGNGSGIHIVKPSNWKTRICNKWEITGYCPFGAKCHFAHGAAELHRFGGGLVEGEGKDGVSPNPDTKQTGQTPKGHSDTTTLLSPGVPHNVDASYHSGVALQRATSAVTQKPGIRTHQKWKGPAKISRIYGDWIDDIE